MIKRRLIPFIIFILSVQLAVGQELDCNVVINADQVQGSNRSVFESMQEAVYNFMNARKWTKDKFKNDERIQCSMLITINKKISQNVFQASIQVQSRRPVYNTSYHSTLVRTVDNNFKFEFAEYQPLTYSDNSFNSNLTSVLAFYAYYVIGTDFDSFSPLGGTPFYEKAQKVVTLAQSSKYEKGWKAFQSTENRYWVAENMLSSTYKPLRQCVYQYHINGLDIMSKDKDKARVAILAALKKLKPVYEQNPINFPFKLFFDAKAKEIINIFSKGQPSEQMEAINLLKKINPSNSSRYDDILKE